MLLFFSAPPWGPIAIDLHRVGAGSCAPLRPPGAPRGDVNHLSLCFPVHLAVDNHIPAAYDTGVYSSIMLVDAGVHRRRRSNSPSVCVDTQIGHETIQ